MPRFEGFNTENKLRIPLSAFAAQIIDNDCLNFSIRKTTLINTIILNYYQKANCTISLRINEYREELEALLKTARVKERESIIDSILNGRAQTLVARFAKRAPADVNWQITLNKRVKEFLTEESLVCEEKFYGQRPGHYIRALIEEYAQLPYHLREAIVFKKILDTINDGIDGEYVLNLTNTKGSHIVIKPYKVETDHLSMFHYLIGYSVSMPMPSGMEQISYPPQIISVRVSRLTNVEIQHLQSGKLTISERNAIENELQVKTVQFVSGKTETIKVWLSDAGIKKYESQIHLRPSFSGIENSDSHIYIFECTEMQALYYFFSFGKDARIISPESLSIRFKQNYVEAMQQYE